MNNLILVKPENEYIDEIRDYRQEGLDNGGHFDGGSGLEGFEDIAAWITQCRLCEKEETKTVAEWVTADQYMLVHEGSKRILGMINFRHTLNEFLAKLGGHIGYAIRPSERRKGYAKAMLALCLEECRKYGLDKVLITCDDGNEASYRTIEACGGKLQDTIDRNGEGMTRRYWVEF